MFSTYPIPEKHRREMVFCQFETPTLSWCADTAPQPTSKRSLSLADNCRLPQLSCRPTVK